MRTVKYPSFTKQPHANAGTFPLRDLRTQLLKQSLNVIPLQVCAGWMQEKQFKDFAVLAFHMRNDAILWHHCQGWFSGLRAVIKTMGGDLEIVARFPDGNVSSTRLKNLMRCQALIAAMLRLKRQAIS
ncbi:MAG: hypothetical protein A2511_06585 [Deltaproteobacteria bacterium RIFOXYD12_FULL_50_9]|nr:MAG: hypothetical protein A2511_06585 [Deltaproteobacteria bacterium RIFOXYD12_FULL_50_9]